MPSVATTEFDGAGIFVFPGSERELISAMLRIAGDEGFRDSYATTARERAGDLGWTSSAAAALDAIREAVP